MNTIDFDYNLPTERIAQHPITPRDHSRLMVLNRSEKTRTHKHFYDIVDYFQKGDVLVWNNSKVFKARLRGKLYTVEGKELFNRQKEIELFLVREMPNEGVWKVLVRPGRHVSNGMRVVMAKDFYCDVMLKEDDGTVLVQFPYSANEVIAKANTYGTVPLPPYVKDEKHELEAYQNIYADDSKEGSVAAPTAGFHFTDEIVEALKAKGVEFLEVTLHVGLGTFLPVKSERIEDHVMHSEWVEISGETSNAIRVAKAEGRRVIAVGTTTVRTLEGVAATLGEQVHPFAGDINLFITPGFEFKVVDALITNFHLPKSTLLILVSAFVGDTDFVLDSYKEAVDNEYRFFSFGDAMFIQ